MDIFGAKKEKVFTNEYKELIEFDCFYNSLMDSDRFIAKSEYIP